MSKKTDLVILSATRTPIGSFLGLLGSVSAPQLGASALRSAIQSAKIDPQDLHQVLMGNVLQAGQGQAPARQAAIAAGVPHHVGAVTINKVCGSGMRSLMDGGNGIIAGEWEMIAAGGMESMTNAPHLLKRGRTGFRMGDIQMKDSMISDGLWDPYGDKHMGNCAESCAKKYQFTREQQDQFSLESYKRAQSAIESGKFKDEITAVQIPQRKGDPIAVDNDEEPFRAPLDRMDKLRPAFDKQGSITAANASKLNDGAAALILTTAAKAKTLGISPLARIVAYGGVAQEPEWFTTAPISAIQKVLKKASLSVSDINRWEINEAFALVTMATIADLALDPALVNVRGGAVALGHPIGCTGARIITTLLHTLRQEKQRYGCAAICIGGGEATAMVLENLTL